MKGQNKGVGLACPCIGCHSTNTTVLGIRDSEKYNLRVRQRKCMDCGCRFHTEERIVQMDAL